jgi:hypothetical protein
LIITAAHLTAFDANMSVRIAGGVVLPAKVLKQGSSEDVDLICCCSMSKDCPRALGYPRCNYVKRHLG